MKRCDSCKTHRRCCWTCWPRVGANGHIRSLLSPREVRRLVRYRQRIEERLHPAPIADPNEGVFYVVLPVPSIHRPQEFWQLWWLLDARHKAKTLTPDEAVQRRAMADQLDDQRAAARAARRAARPKQKGKQ